MKSSLFKQTTTNQISDLPGEDVRVMAQTVGNVLAFFLRIMAEEWQKWRFSADSFLLGRMTGQSEALLVLGLREAVAFWLTLCFSSDEIGSAPPLALGVASPSSSLAREGEVGGECWHCKAFVLDCLFGDAEGKGSHRVNEDRLAGGRRNSSARSTTATHLLALSS